MAATLLPRSAKKNKWYFTREQIHNSPSRRAGLDPDKELSYRQRAANLIQDIGQRLNVCDAELQVYRSQLTINTAIVYMHRFYMIQSFTRFHRNVVGPAALFLATKVEEQPRKLEHVVKVANVCLNPQDPSPDSRKPTYQLQAQDVVVLENIILQTLGFDVRINHPHTHVVKCTELVRASKDLAQTSYFMATNSLHLTTFCLQYSPTVVACVCIHLACKWSNWEIPVSTDSKHWWEYVDPTVTLELLDELTHEFLQILEKTPSCLKRIRNWKAPGQKKSKTSDEGGKTDTMMNMLALESESALASLMSLAAPPSTSSTSSVTLPAEDKQPVVKEPNPEPPAPPRVSLSLSEYRAKHADELAAQKKKLENMEASVKRDYATAAQALMNQQRKEKHHHNHHQQQQQQQHGGSSSSEPILLKIPLEKRHDRGSHKTSQSGSNRASEHNIKVKIRVSEKGSADELRSKDKHRERSNHHHHHHHHHHHSSSGYSSSSAPHKHSSSASSSKKSAGDGARTNSSSSSSRKRTHPSEPTAGSHPAKIGKPSRNSFQLPQLSSLPADILPSLALSQPQGSFSHSKSDKADTNGHGMGAGGQPNEFQDTYDMLNSLLSAQGVQPTQPPMLYTQYNEYRFAQHPPLPLEPPPHLPPLPK